MFSILKCLILRKYIFSIYSAKDKTNNHPNFVESSDAKFVTDNGGESIQIQNITTKCTLNLDQANQLLLEHANVLQHVSAIICVLFDACHLTYDQLNDLHYSCSALLKMNHTFLSCNYGGKVEEKENTANKYISDILHTTVKDTENNSGSHYLVFMTDYVMGLVDCLAFGLMVCMGDDKIKSLSPDTIKQCANAAGKAINDHENQTTSHTSEKLLCFMYHIISALYAANTDQEFTIDSDGQSNNMDHNTDDTNIDSVMGKFKDFFDSLVDLGGQMSYVNYFQKGLKALIKFESEIKSNNTEKKRIGENNSKLSESLKTIANNIISDTNEDASISPYSTINHVTYQMNREFAKEHYSLQNYFCLWAVEELLQSTEHGIQINQKMSIDKLIRKLSVCLTGGMDSESINLSTDSTVTISYKEDDKQGKNPRISSCKCTLLVTDQEKPSSNLSTKQQKLSRMVITDLLCNSLVSFILNIEQTNRSLLEEDNDEEGDNNIDTITELLNDRKSKGKEDVINTIGKFVLTTSGNTDEMKSICAILRVILFMVQNQDESDEHQLLTLDKFFGPESVDNINLEEGVMDDIEEAADQITIKDSYTSLNKVKTNILNKHIKKTLSQNLYENKVYIGLGIVALGILGWIFREPIKKFKDYVTDKVTTLLNTPNKKKGQPAPPPNQSNNPQNKKLNNLQNKKDTSQSNSQQ